jgi:hypothetical protein
MPVPAVAGGRLDIVVLEDRRVVDQHRDRLADRLCGRGQKRLHLRFDGQVSLHHLGPPSQRADLGGGRLGRFALPE